MSASSYQTMMISRRKLILLIPCVLIALFLVAWGVRVVLRGIRIRSLARQCWDAPFGDVEKCIDRLADAGPAAAATLSGLLEHPNWQVRAHAVRRLEEMRGETAMRAVEQSLKDKCWPVRAAAVSALPAVAGKECFDALVRALDDPSAHVRGSAAQALGDLRDDRACAPLAEFLERESSDHVRAKAVSALKRPLSPKAIPGALRSLHDRCSFVRWDAANILGVVPGGAEYVDALIEAASDRSTFVRKRVFFALGTSRSGKAVPTLADALAEDRAECRSKACLALGMIGSRSAVDPLVSALGDPAPAVRERAVDALARLEDEKVLAALVKATSDPCQYVREKALLAVWWKTGAGFDGCALDGDKTRTWWENKGSQVRGEETESLRPARDGK